MGDPQLDAKVPILILLNKQACAFVCPALALLVPVPHSPLASCRDQDVAEPKTVERMKEAIGALAATSHRPSALFPICALNGYI